MRMRTRLVWAAAGLTAVALLTACESEATVTIGPDAQPTNVSARLEVPKAALSILGITDLSDFEEALRSDLDEADLPEGAAVDFLEEGDDFVFTASTPVTTTEEALQVISNTDETPWTLESSTEGGISVTMTREAPAATTDNPLGENFEVRQYLTLVMPGPIESATSDGPPPAIEGNSVRFQLTNETTTVTALSTASSGSGPLLWIGILVGLLLLGAIIAIFLVVSARRRRVSPGTDTPSHSNDTGDAPTEDQPRDQDPPVA